MRYTSKRAGFTLVELLVVIGIIAVLIGILLPTLNKARQAANTVACAANEHSMGLLLANYESENKGYFPYGSAKAAGSGGSIDQYGGPWDEPTWSWPDTLTLMVTRRSQIQSGPWNYQASSNPSYIDRLASDFLGIFHDKDLPVSGFGNRAGDYCANIRVLVDNFTYDPFQTNASSPKQYLHILNSSSVRSGASTAMIWCSGVQCSNTGVDYGADACSYETDGADWSYSTGFCTPPARSWVNSAYLGSLVGCGKNDGQSINPGSVTLQTLKANNKDWVGSYNQAAEMRYRHNNNNTCNLLFIDGHVESRRIGSVYGRDVMVHTTPTTFAGIPGT